MNLLPDAPSTSSNDQPLYNIGVVTRMTDISMATLRAWERRYNFPEARRTSGGHRLYSEKDIMRLRWVKERIEEGMQTARAISALVHQEEIGKFSAGSTYPLPIEAGLTAENNTALQAYQNQLTAVLIQRNLEKAEQILAEALAISSPEDLILNLIGPTLADIGTAWEKNQVSVATEHFVTNFLRQRLLLWMVSGPPAQAKAPVILACGPNEWHEGSLLMLGAILRRRRWPVAYLGQSILLKDLASFVREIRPSAIVLVAMTELSAGELIDWPLWLPEIAQSGKPPVCYGGRIFTQSPEWRERMPGIFLGPTVQLGLEELERILNHNE